MTYTILAESRLGRAFTCNCASCDAIHIEFTNIALNLKLGELYQFKSLVDSIDETYCHEYFAEAIWRRKIQIQIKPTLTMLAFTSEELEDLRTLLERTSEAICKPSSVLRQRSPEHSSERTASPQTSHNKHFPRRQQRSVPPHLLGGVWSLN